VSLKFLAQVHFKIRLYIYHISTAMLHNIILYVNYLILIRLRRSGCGVLCCVVCVVEGAIPFVIGGSNDQSYPNACALIKLCAGEQSLCCVAVF